MAHVTRAARRVVLAPDAYKESLSAQEARRAMRAGAERAAREAGVEVEIIEAPISDGGAGFVDALRDVLTDVVRQVEVCGPLGERVLAALLLKPAPSGAERRIPRIVARSAAIGALAGLIVGPWGGFFAGASAAMLAFAGAFLLHPLLRDRARFETAALEMSSAAGLMLVPRELRDPERTTTYGVGELIKAALDEGVRSILVGIGNSGTTDGGAGMAAALGARFYDEHERLIERPSGGDLVRIARVEIDGLDPRLDGVEVIVACDVKNPLCGPEGSARVFGPQKGATPEQVERLDKGLRNFANRVAQAGFKADPDAPGMGAAGGIAFGLAAFCNARLTPGAALVMDATGFDERLRASVPTMLLTGEGRLDGQSLSGKATYEAGRRAKDARARAVALPGSVGDGWERATHTRGGVFDEVRVIAPEEMSTEEALRRAGELLERAAHEAVRDWLRPPAGG